MKINSKQQRSSKVRNTTQNDEAPSRATPRRTRSRSERNKEIKRQLNESALAQMQLSLDAQGASAAIIPPRSPLKKGRRDMSRSRSPGHKRRGKCKSTTAEQQAPFTNGHPDSSLTPSIRAPRRSLSQPMTLKQMQTSLDSSTIATTTSNEEEDTPNAVRPPRSPTKFPRRRHIQSNSPVSVASLIESEVSTGSSPVSTSHAISAVRAMQTSQPGHQSNENDLLIQLRDERKERRLLRRNRSASLTPPKRCRSSSSSRRTKNVQLVRKSDQGFGNNDDISVNTAQGVSKCTASIESSSISWEQQQNGKPVSYPSPKEEPAKKGDSPPAPPRKAVQPDGDQSKPIETSPASWASTNDDLCESVIMDPSIPAGLVRAESDSVSASSSTTPGLVVSTSTRRKNRPARTSSTTSCGAAPLPRPGLTRRRSRQSESSSFKSSGRAPKDFEKTDLTEKAKKPTTESSALAMEQPPVDPVPGQVQPQEQPRAIDPRPPKAPQSKSGKDKPSDNQHARAQRGRNFISGLKQSFSFSNRNKRRSKSATRSAEKTKTKETRRSIALSSFLKNPAVDSPPSPANTERTGHTVSTMSTEQSDMSNSNRLLDSPTRVYDPQLLRIRPLNLARLRVEFDKPRGVDRDEDDGAINPAADTRGLEIDTHILVAAAASANVESDPASILAAHFARLNKTDASQGKDIKEEDEASDIESLGSGSSSNEFSLMPPSRSRSFSPAPTRRHKSRSRSRSKKGRRSKKMVRPSVNFGKVYIREYERGLGDSPAVSSGPPIGLGWSYLEATEIPVEHYETSVRAPAPRRRKDFFLSPKRRFHILLDEWGCTLQDICRARDEAAEIRCQRQISVFGNASMTQQVKNKAAVAVAAAAAAAEKEQKKSNKSGSKKKARSRSKSPSPPVPLETPVPRRDQWPPKCPSSHIPPAPLELSV